MICLLIINPNANKGKSKRIGEEILNSFKKTDNVLKIKTTTKKGDARVFAYEAVGSVDIIAACGGDGTVNEVSNGILSRCEELNLPIEKRPKLAIFPVGRGNDFAWMMGIDIKQVEQIIDNIVKDKHKVIDAGWCKGGDFPNGAYFVNGLGIGFEPLVNFKASSYKKISGALSYLFALFYVLKHYPRPMKLKVLFGKEKVHLETQQISVGNGKRMGHMFLMTPSSVVDDGLFDVVYANQPIKKKNIIAVAMKFFSGKQVDDYRFSSRRETEIMIESEDNDMAIHIDGEKVGVGLKNIEILLKKKAIAIIC